MKQFTRERSFKTRSADGTMLVAESISEILKPPRLIVLQGELGMGKTTLVKGWLGALGAAAPEEVTSPTFTLVHEYASKHGKVYHLDLYRLETERELISLGVDEMADEPGALVLVEWGEKFASILNRADAEVSVTALEGDERAFRVRWNE